MIVKPNEELASYTTFKIGGRTPNMFIPESSEEFFNLVREFKNKNKQYYILGNGSNILVNDKGVSREVINNTRAFKFIDFKGKGIVEVGSSVKLAEFIRSCTDNNLKIFTKLITIPGTMGGAIYMNAGRNREEVSDCLECVKVFDGEKTKELTKQECLFSHRHSVFHKKKDWIIMSAKYRFRNQPKEESVKQMTEELENAKKYTYFKHPSAGSVFKDKHDFIMRILKGIKIGNAKYSMVDDNSILNLGNARSKDVVNLLNLARFLHFVTLQKCALEIEIWN